MSLGAPVQVATLLTEVFLQHGYVADECHHVNQRFRCKSTGDEQGRTLKPTKLKLMSRICCFLGALLVPIRASSD